MTMKIVSVSELQKHASRLVREVEQGGVEYHISVRGRLTGVVLRKAPPRAQPAIIQPLKRR